MNNVLEGEDTMTIINQENLNDSISDFAKKLKKIQRFTPVKIDKKDQIKHGG